MIFERHLKGRRERELIQEMILRDELESCAILSAERDERERLMFRDELMKQIKPTLVSPH